MKKLGIVGGVAWPSTIDYYRSICRLSIEHHKARNISEPLPLPEMSIESLNINRSYGLRGGSVLDDKSWERYDDYFRQALLRLQRNGVDVAIIASCTPHNRIESIATGIDVPVIGVFQAVAEHCRSLGVKRMLILGSAPTMESPKFPEALRRVGIDAWAPQAPEDRNEILSLIEELYAELDRNAARRIADVVRRGAVHWPHPPTACLACTELPLAFREIERKPDALIDGITYINTTMVHAKAAFEAVVAR